MKQDIIIAPSILSADFAKLGEDVQSVIDAGAELIHFDVMDNHYVPNLTFGPLVCSALKSYGISKPIDVHLMIKPVDRIIPDFAKAGADFITFHLEASEHVDRTIDLIKSFNVKAGVVLNPATPVSLLEPILHKCDMVLLMSVNPGFPGQSFIPYVLEKLTVVRKLIDDKGLNIRLEVDGGVNLKNVKEVVDAGADTLVMGSAIFNTSNYNETIQSIKNQLNI